mmetsp:Transcript_15356/g.62653  ORF Transcript_15356/g.62653 Transcript_15356/m.62653 type:complete len:119 (+) Transcript_15356:1848-2204(+)
MSFSFSVVKAETSTTRIGEGILTGAFLTNEQVDVKNDPASRILPSAITVPRWKPTSSQVTTLTNLLAQGSELVSLEKAGSEHQRGTPSPTFAESHCDGTTDMLKTAPFVFSIQGILLV